MHIVHRRFWKPLNDLVVSSMFYLPEKPVGKGKRFLRKETIVSYILLIIINEVEIPDCDKG